jgi:hypothetical protein
MAKVPGPKWLLTRRRMFLNAVGLAETLPASVRPSVVIRRKALSQGLLGESSVWRLVAVFVLLRKPIERVVLRQPEPLGRYRIRPGSTMRVSSFEPTTRKQRKELGLTKKKLYDEAMTEIQDPNFRP